MAQARIDINLADTPPFIASQWINVGKKYPTKNTPYEVAWAKEDLLKIPTNALQQLPATTLPVADFIQAKLPQQSAEIITTKAKIWFSPDEAHTNISMLLTRPIPPSPFLIKLEAELGQAWFDGARSIVDPRFNNSTDRLPFWAIKFWKELEYLLDKQDTWRNSHQWLEREKKKTTDPLTLQAIHDAQEMMKVLPWNTTMVGNHKTLELAAFFSGKWFGDGHIDMMMRDLAEQVEADPLLKGKVIIAPLQFSEQIKIAAKKNTKVYNRETAMLLYRYMKHIKENGTERLYFPIHIRGNHWIACCVNFKTRDIAFGECFR